MRRFEFIGGTSSKFWEIEQSGSELTVHFGRIGTRGQVQVKDLGSWDAAAERVRRLIAEKLREGYKEVGRSSVGPDAAQGVGRRQDLPPYEPRLVPADGPLTLGGVKLPSGHRLVGDPIMALPGIEMVAAPVAWRQMVVSPNRAGSSMRFASQRLPLSWCL